LLFACYLVAGPASWLFDAMGLTPISGSFKIFLLAVAVAGFGLSWCAERYILPYLAFFIGRLKLMLLSGGKKRKLYKILEKEMRV
jgi:cation-transporting P-type ATPase 13A2